MRQDQGLGVADVQLVVRITELSQQQLWQQLVHLRIGKGQGPTAGRDGRRALLQRGAIGGGHAAKGLVQRAEDGGPVLHRAGERLVA